MQIIPRTKLIIWVGLLFIPVSVLAAVIPAVTESGIGLTIGFLAVTIFDAAVSRKLLAGIRVTLPAVMRLSVGRETEMTLSIESEAARIKQLRLGLSFPREIYSENQDLVTELPEESPHSIVAWPFKALKQGRYFFENCYLETASRMGFWSLRRTEAARSEVRVYPDLFRERKKLSGLFLNRGIGVHALRQVGKGREFEQLREYLPGDSYEDIHWKATARRGQPITKVYQIERTQQIYVIVDGSRLSARNSDPQGSKSVNMEQPGVDDFTTIMERYAAAALVLGLAADRQADEFGLLAFDDRVRKFIRAKSGKAHYNVCRDALHTMQARSVTPDFNELFTFLATKIRRRALLILLTNLDDPVLAKSFTANIDVISRRHLVLVNMLKPVGAQPLFSDASANTVDDIYRKLGHHLQWRHLRETEKHLRRRGVGFCLLENENLCTDIVSQYLTVKRRQIL
ncbi:MAG: DUF58 domain-containing protein [Desulfobacterales bacterium]|jgi:uncharacterized protein (DUF58 family)